MQVNNLYNLYELTLPIVSAATFIMGVTLIVLCTAKKYGRLYNKTGLVFLAIAIFMLCLINSSEYLVGENNRFNNNAFAIVIFAASIELWLLYFAYMSMLDRTFVTYKKILKEIILILLFTTPPLFIDESVYPLEFTVSFWISFAFYVVKLILNVFYYKRVMRTVKQNIEDYHSEASSLLLSWINSTFFVVVTIGIVSVIIPLTNFLGLIIYNVFVFFAYTYIYIEVIHNIHVFDGNMEKIHISDLNQNNELLAEEKNNAIRSGKSFLDGREYIYERWLSEKSYCKTDITIEDIASELKTTRYKLSLYIKNELNTNYYDWIARLRMEEAKKQLIEYPDAPICEIAIMVGIEDKSNFGRVFKRHTGVSPSAYREDYLLLKDNY